MDSGFITLHRKIKEHWVFKDPKHFHAFVTMLLEVRWKDTEERVLIKGELMTCGRGQSLKSAAGWAKCFGGDWTPRKVRNFFQTLVQDEIIILQTSNKTSHLTICNYETYQSIGKAPVTQTSRTRNADVTQTSTEEEGNKETKKEIETCLTFERFWEMYGKKGNRKTSEARFNKVSEANRVLIAKNLEAYVISTPDKQFRKDAQSWLNMECWNDEVMITQLTPNGEPEFKMLTNEDLRR